jgi:hypothetical protein
MRLRSLQTLAVTTHSWNLNEQCCMKLIGQASQQTFTAAAMAGALRHCGLVPLDPPKVLDRLLRESEALAAGAGTSGEATVVEGLAELDEEEGEASGEEESAPAVALPAPTPAAGASAAERRQAVLASATPASPQQRKGSKALRVSQLITAPAFEAQCAVKLAQLATREAARKAAAELRAQKAAGRAAARADGSERAAMVELRAVLARLDPTAAAQLPPLPVLPPGATAAGGGGPSRAALQPVQQGSAGAGGEAGGRRGGGAGASVSGMVRPRRAGAAGMSGPAAPPQPKPRGRAARKRSRGSDSEAEWESEGSE